MSKLHTSLRSVQVCKHIRSASGLPVCGAEIYTKQQWNRQTGCRVASLPSAPSAPFDLSPQQPEQLAVAPTSHFFLVTNLAAQKHPFILHSPDYFIVQLGIKPGVYWLIIFYIHMFKCSGFDNCSIKNNGTLWNLQKQNCSIFSLKYWYLMSSHVVNK